MEIKNYKNIIIVSIAIAIAIVGGLYLYDINTKPSDNRLEVVNIISTEKVNQNVDSVESAAQGGTQNKLGDSWIKGDYKYVVEKRSGPFYFVSVTNNTSECLNAKATDDLAPCAGGGYYGKDGESWAQALSESLDCSKIVSLGFPKDFDSNISSCYN